MFIGVIINIYLCFDIHFDIHAKILFERRYFTRDHFIISIQNFSHIRCTSSMFYMAVQIMREWQSCQLSNFQINFQDSALVQVNDVFYGFTEVTGP